MGRESSVWVWRTPARATIRLGQVDLSWTTWGLREASHLTGRFTAVSGFSTVGGKVLQGEIRLGKARSEYDLR